MNPLGVHALVWVGDWSEASARYAIESTRQVGFDLIEVPILDPSTVDAAMTRRLLQDNGLGAACSLGLDDATDVSSEDPAVVARGRDRLAAAVEVAHGIGASHLCGVLYSKLGKYPRPMSPAGRQHVVESMTWLAKQASDAGLSLALEVVNRYETNVVNTVADMLALIDDTGAAIGVHLDSYHVNIEENGYVEPVRLAGSRLGYVHVGESHRGYLGSGTIDFDTFLGAVRDSGFTGPVTFESFSSAVVHPDLSNTLAVWRNLWEDSLDLATHARAFMAERLGSD
ncbi:MAG: D-tagatose 3-epimerase [Frankiales bacterium]|nr:D-tagatose 3-epimerase [Frankiales bacterium]